MQLRNSTWSEECMQPIPDDILKPFDTVLEEKAVPISLRENYWKWLRYYLDFRVKYPPPDVKSEQVRLFIEKMRSKGPVAEETRAGSACPLALFCHATSEEAGCCVCCWDDGVGLFLEPAATGRETYTHSTFTHPPLGLPLEGGEGCRTEAGPIACRAKQSRKSQARWISDASTASSILLHRSWNPEDVVSELIFDCFLPLF